MTDPRRPIEDDRLDELIDTAAAREVRLPAPADLRARVMARLSEEPRASRPALGRWAAIAAAAVLAVLAIVSRRPPEVTPPPVPSAPVMTEARTSVPAPAAAAGTAPQVAAERERPADEDGAASNGADDSLMISRLETIALDDIEPLTSAPSRIAPLPREPIVVAPLSVETEDSHQVEDMP